MPSIKRFMMFCLASAAISANAQTINQSVAAEEGLLTRPSNSSAVTVKPPKPEPSTVRVVAIYGSASNLSTDLMVDEVTPHQNLTVGSRIKTNIADCEIAQIQDRCVRLMPVLVAKQKSKTSISPKVCPLTCWTGIEPVKQQNIAGGMGAMPAGMPMPIVQIPGAIPVPTAARPVIAANPATTPASARQQPGSRLGVQ